MPTGEDAAFVDIRLNGRCLHFVGELPPEVLQRFAIRRRVFDGGVRAAYQQVLDSTDQISNQGLLDPLTHELTRRGIAWQIPPELIQAPFDSRVASLRAGEFSDGDVITLVDSAREGIVTFSPGVSTTRLTVQITTAFAGKSVVIVCNSGETAYELTQQIRSNGLAVTQVIRRQIGEHEHVHPIVVTTLFGCEHGPVELKQSDLVIFPDARHSLHDQAEYELSKPGSRFRLLGFLPHELRLTEYDRDRLVRHFGLHRLYVPRHGHRMTDVRVQYMPIHGKQLRVAETLLALKQVGIFQNHLRNRLIAKIAKQFAAGDLAAYAPLWPDVAQGLRSSAAKSVAVVVENAQHAEKMRDHLRGWAVWTDCRERRVAENDRLARFGEAVIEKTSGLICTVDGLNTAPVENTDVLIWAASGSRGPQIPLSRMIRPYGAERPLLVIDFADFQHSQLAAWSHQRQDDYLHREWIPLGYDLQDFRILRFLRVGE